MAPFAFTRSGSGAPLVLLHALGSSRRVWDPVVPALSEHFDVLAIDLPGFGESAPLPPEVEPSPVVLAGTVAGLLDDLGIGTAHVVGNSLGGWVALELAALRPAASLTLLSPAGLWRDATPLYCRASLRASRWLSRHAAGLLSHLVTHRGGRALVLGQTHGRPARMTPDPARAPVRAVGTPPGPPRPGPGRGPGRAAPPGLPPPRGGPPPPATTSPGRPSTPRSPSPSEAVTDCSSRGSPVTWTSCRPTRCCVPFPAAATSL